MMLQDSSTTAVVILGINPLLDLHLAVHESAPGGTGTKYKITVPIHSLHGLSTAVLTWHLEDKT